MPPPDDNFGAVTRLVDELRAARPTLDIRLKNYIYGSIRWPKVLGSAFSLDRADSFTIKYSTVIRFVAHENPAGQTGRDFPTTPIVEEQPEPQKWYDVDESVGDIHVVRFLVLANPDIAHPNVRPSSQLTHRFIVRKTTKLQWNRPVPAFQLQFVDPDVIEHPSQTRKEAPSNELEPFYLLEFPLVKISSSLVKT